MFFRESILPGLFYFRHRSACTTLLTNFGIVVLRNVFFECEAPASIDAGRDR